MQMPLKEQLQYVYIAAETVRTPAQASNIGRWLRYIPVVEPRVVHACLANPARAAALCLMTTICTRIDVLHWPDFTKEYRQSVVVWAFKFKATKILKYLYTLNPGCIQGYLLLAVLNTNWPMFYFSLRCGADITYCYPRMGTVLRISITQGNDMWCQIKKIYGYLSPDLREVYMVQGVYEHVDIGPTIENYLRVNADRMCPPSTLWADGDTTLHQICHNGHWDWLQYMDIRNCLEVRDPYGNTPLLRCMLGIPNGYSLGRIKVIKHLLQLGADVNAQNYLGCSPLVAAARHENFDIVRMLVCYRACVPNDMMSRMDVFADDLPSDIFYRIIAMENVGYLELSPRVPVTNILVWPPNCDPKCRDDFEYHDVIQYWVEAPGGYIISADMWWD